MNPRQQFRGRSTPAHDSAPSPVPPRPRRRWRRCALVLLLLAAYPIFVLATTWTITLRSGLVGGRHGPCDAYRHTLASAIVAWTTSPQCVEWVTAAMEGIDAGASHRMDAHNNRAGIRLAARAPDWWSLLRSVRTAVDAGTVLDDTALADPDRIVWLPAERWAERWW